MAALRRRCVTVYGYAEHLYGARRPRCGWRECCWLRPPRSFSEIAVAVDSDRQAMACVHSDGGGVERYESTPY